MSASSSSNHYSLVVSKQNAVDRLNKLVMTSKVPILTSFFYMQPGPSTWTCSLCVTFPGKSYIHYAEADNKQVAKEIVCANILNELGESNESVHRYRQVNPVSRRRYHRFRKNQKKPKSIWNKLNTHERREVLDTQLDNHRKRHSSYYKPVEKYHWNRSLSTYEGYDDLVAKSQALEFINV